MNIKIYIASAGLFLCFFAKANKSSEYTNTSNSATDKAETLKEKFNSGDYSLNSFAFTENKGQIKGYDGLAHPEVKFVFQQGNTQLFLLEKGIAYQFTKVHYPEGYIELVAKRPGTDDLKRQEELQKQIRTETFRMDMTLVGANKRAEVTTEGKSSDYTNYYNHNVLDVYNFSKVTYHDIYPGIDWVLYTKSGELKYDFVVHPGADPSLIQLKFENQESIELNKDGSFTLKNLLGYVTEKRPVSFQAGKRVSTQFILKGNVVSFNLGNYESNRTLEIDPSLVWGTYYGFGFSIGNSCATDQAGNVYLSGFTSATSGIGSGGHQNNFSGVSFFDAFLVKFNTAGVRQWGTYYGGDGFGSDDRAYGIATDAVGNVYMTGSAPSSTNIAFAGHQNTSSTGGAFLVKFNGNGVRQWGTYYNGSAHSEGNSCATDATGDVYLAGHTTSTNNIASAGHQNLYGGARDAFLVKFNSAGVRQWGTYYGGAGVESYPIGCRTDPSGNVYLCGDTRSSSGVSANGHQNNYGGSPNTFTYTGGDAFLAKFNSNGIRQWGTYYGGAGDETYSSCSTDGLGNVYLAGTTNSTINIAATGHQNAMSGVDDAYLVKFNGNGIRQWATYYGGSTDIYGASSNEKGVSCSVDANGDVYLSGVTSSTNNIAHQAFKDSVDSFQDAFLAKFTTNGLRSWGTYFGGDPTSGPGEIETFCSIDVSGNIYLVGSTGSLNNIAMGGHQNSTSAGGGYTAFLSKFCNSPAVVISSSSPTICLGDSANLSVSGASSYTWSTGSNNASIVISPSVTSSYTAAGTGSNSCVGSAIFTQIVEVCVIGINEAMADDQSVFVFPNPSTGELTLKSEQGGRLEITNSLGQLVYKHEINSGENKLSITNLPNGIYFANLKSENFNKTIKMIKE